MSEMLEISMAFNVSPQRLYEDWLNSAAHSAFTGSLAVIDPQIGGAFNAWDGYIRGETLALEPFSRILQSWRTSEFPDEAPNSLLEVLIQPNQLGSLLTLRHTEIPDGQGEQYYQGWEDYYFTPMQAYYASKA